MRGLRLSKTANGITSNYIYDMEGRLLQEKRGNTRINYLYNMKDLIGFSIPYTENGTRKQCVFWIIWMDATLRKEN